MIYFLTDGEYTKIGFTTQFDVQDRVKNLQIGNARPLVLLGVLEGGQDVERFLHSVLGELRVGGEWFDLRGAKQMTKMTKMTDAEKEGHVDWLTLKLDVVSLLIDNPHLSATQIANQLGAKAKLRTIQRIVKAWKNEHS